MKTVTQAIAISDTHLGCRFALCPSKVTLDGGGVYRPNKIQEWINRRWADFWRWTDAVTEGKPWVLIHCGDVLDHRHHGAVSHWSENLNDQEHAALDLMGAVLSRRNRPAAYFQIRGTEAHSGPMGEAEESIARQLGAVRDADGSFSSNELWLRIGKGLVHFSHHIGTTGSMHYEATAVCKELCDAYGEAGRNREEPPDMVVRAHRHRLISVVVPTRTGIGTSITLPSWQGRTPFVFRLSGGRNYQPQVGGILIRYGDEHLYARPKTWTIARPRPRIVTVGGKQ